MACFLPEAARCANLVYWRTNTLFLLYTEYVPVRFLANMALNLILVKSAGCDATTSVAGEEGLVGAAQGAGAGTLRTSGSVGEFGASAVKEAVSSGDKTASPSGGAAGAEGATAAPYKEPNVSGEKKRHPGERFILLEFNMKNVVLCVLTGFVGAAAFDYFVGSDLLRCFLRNWWRGGGGGGADGV